MNDLQASLIEDVAIGPSGLPQSFVPSIQHTNAAHPGYGLQLPQPLKQAPVLNTSYMAPQNTMKGFDHYQQNAIGVGATQSSAIRGRLTSPHIYQWDAAPMLQKNTDYRAHSGMINPSGQPQQFARTLDPAQSLRDAISAIYGNASMLKTQQIGAYSVYNCPVENMTSGPMKYIVAIVPNHEYVQLGAYHSLNSLPWVSFQTRTTENPAAVFGSIRPAAITYTIPRDPGNPVFDKINMVLDDKAKFTYIAEAMPCKIELLKQKEGDVASQKSSIMSALEAFKTVIVIS